MQAFRFTSRQRAAAVIGAMFLLLLVAASAWLAHRNIARGRGDRAGAWRLAVYAMAVGMASRLEWDNQGRILIPEKTMQRAKISREVTFVGGMDHLELWNRGDWELRREQLRGRKEQLAERMKQSWLKTPNSIANSESSAQR